MNYLYILAFIVGIELVIMFCLMHMINNNVDEIRLLKIRMDQQEETGKDILNHVNTVLEHDNKVIQKCSDVLVIDQNINDQLGVILQRDKELIDIQKGKHEEVCSVVNDIS